ncbi:MAG: HAD family hydrolase [Candidatus Omnitrophota bacterium]
MIDSVLFDFGGTLDTNGIHWSEKFWDIYCRFDIRICQSDVRLAFVDSEIRLSREDIPRDTSFLSLLEKQIFYQLAFLQGIQKLETSDSPHILSKKMAGACYADVLRFIPGVKQILEQLKTGSGYQLGLVSNNHGTLAHVCQCLGIAHYFSIIVDSKVVGVSKPDPEIFQIPLRAMRISPENCVVVGDSYDRDIVPAKSIGCRTVWLRGRGWKAPERDENVEKADFRIDSLEELPGLLIF